MESMSDQAQKTVSGQLATMWCGLGLNVPLPDVPARAPPSYVVTRSVTSLSAATDGWRRSRARR